MSTITLTCSHCDVPFEKRLASYRADLKRRGDRFFCSRKCVGQYQKAQATVYLTCTACQVDFTRTLGEMSPGDNNFCSVQCSATFTSSSRKLPRISKCKYCEKQFPSLKRGNRIACDACKQKRNLVGMSKGQLYASRKSRASARSSIATHARKVFREHWSDPACVANGCGYSKHVEVSHRQDVADFPDDTLVSVINDISNLVGLCPTHHWEFDHDALDEPLPDCPG